MDSTEISAQIQIKNIELNNAQDPNQKAKIQKALHKLRLQKQIADIEN